MNKRYALALIVVTIGASLVTTPAGAETVSCTVDLPDLEVSPGLSTEPTSGVFHSTSPGTIDCEGRKGTIRADGRYGISGPASCQSGGDGWGVFAYSFGDGTTIHDTFTAKFGANTEGTDAGEIQGERLSGKYTFTGTKGNCVTEPITLGDLKMPAATYIS